MSEVSILILKHFLHLCQRSHRRMAKKNSDRECLLINMKENFRKQNGLFIKFENTSTPFHSNVIFQSCFFFFLFLAMVRRPTTNILTLWIIHKFSNKKCKFIKKNTNIYLLNFYIEMVLWKLNLVSQKSLVI